MTNFARQKPGRFGVDSAYTWCDGTSQVTSTLTLAVRVPTPYRKVILQSASAQAEVAPVITTGTATATLKKFVANGGGTVALSAGLDLETLVANKAKAFVLLTTVTEADFTAIQDDTNGGDTFFVEIVTGTTVATAPVELFFVCEFAVID
jgi:hypothetical protein